MRIRNIKRKIRLRFLTYVLSIIFFLFILIVLYSFVLKLFRSGVFVVDESVSESVSTIADWKVGSIVEMKGSIYRKMINQEPYYVLFDNLNDLRYILDRSEQNWLDGNLGKELVISGEILRFVGTVPYVLVLN